MAAIRLPALDGFAQSGSRFHMSAAGSFFTPVQTEQGSVRPTLASVDAPGMTDLLHAARAHDMAPVAAPQLPFGSQLREWANLLRLTAPDLRQAVPMSADLLPR